MAPGACDNAAGLSALLGLAAAMRHAELFPAIPILFAANVGEEGEGDLRGMRHLFDSNASPYASRIAGALALEGGGSSAVVTRALASRRFRITVTGPGGHSWTDAGAPNPILILARALLALESIDLPHGEPRTTLNIGHISGGTSINSIPSSATAWLDLRSTDSAQLQAAELALRESLDQWITNAPAPPSHRGTRNPPLPSPPPRSTQPLPLKPLATVLAALSPMVRRCWPLSAPSTAISISTPSPAWAPRTPTYRSPAAFPPSPSAPEASVAASTRCRSGTTPPAVPPRFAALCSPCSTPRTSPRKSPSFFQARHEPFAPIFASNAYVASNPGSSGRYFLRASILNFNSSAAPRHTSRTNSAALPYQYE